MRGIAASVLVVAFAVLLTALPAAASPAQNTATTAYRIQEGDTLWSLSRRFGTTPERLAAMNAMSVEATLSIGRMIRVPSSRAVGSRTVSGAVGRPSARTQAPVATRVHRIQPGDTLWSLSRRYGTTPERLAAMNGITLTTTLRLERPLKVPGTAPSVRPAGAVERVDPAEAAARREAIRKRLATLPSRGEKWTDDLLTLSRRYLGVRYRWGGTTPRAFDCSGFMYYVYARMGVSLPRTTFEMYDAGVPVPREELKAGDLVFFQTISPGPSHAGIYLGDGRFIHSSSGAGRVLISTMLDGYYAPRYLGARRF
ncbi:MAG: NlpC/P60 family protein [Armatimonadota bacterium]|nr:NlpC/P60 family protein [Armatimonadota bacterium]